MQVFVPLKSTNLQDHLDEKSYVLFNPYYGVENVEKLKPLVDAAYFLGF